MKFVLFLIKALSLFLCLGLLCAYFYYAFFAETKSQFMADASLLLFVLSAVITALTIVLSENKIKSAPATGLDAYLAQLRKEEKNTAKQIQNALPKDLLTMLEKALVAMSENQEALNTTLSDNKAAFSSALSENKNALGLLLSENQNTLTASVTEGMHILETRLSDNNSSFEAALNNLLEQVTVLANKNTAPINMALENINTRLDDLENKIISNRIGSLSQEQPFETVSESSNDVISPTKENEIITVANEFENTVPEPVANEVENTVPEPDMAESVSGYADGLAPNTETDQRNAFDDDLSALADLEIMQEPVAPTAEPKFDEIDIDEFLKGRTDVKN